VQPASSTKYQRGMTMINVNSTETPHTMECISQLTAQTPLKRVALRLLTP